MKKIISFTFIAFLLSLSICSKSANAQDSLNIRGTVLNESAEPIGFTTISILNDDVHISTAITDVRGTFKFLLPSVNSSTIKLNVRAMGYQDTTLSLSGQNIYDLKILLKDAEYILEEVTIEADKPMLVQEVDRLVVDVENSFLKDMINSIEVIKRLPGVFLLNDVFSFEGRPGVVFLINGRTNYMPNDQFLNYLRSIPADNILNVEIITNPSAKYESNGNVILNIILKKKIGDGLVGSLSYSPGISTYLSNM